MSFNEANPSGELIISSVIFILSIGGTLVLYFVIKSLLLSRLLFKPIPPNKFPIPPNTLPTIFAPIPNIPPCQLLPEEAENLIKTYMRENNVILFLKKNFESSDIQGCEGKVIGTNVSQGAIMSTGETLIFIVDDTEIIDDTVDDS